MVGKLVGNIITIGKDLFIICTYQEELIDFNKLGEAKKDESTGIKMWDIEVGTMYIEDADGIRYFGSMESLSDKGEDGLIITGTSCLFTDKIEDAYIESFFRIRSLIPKKGDSEETGLDYSDAINHVRQFEPIIRDYTPERFI
jgi:hypothetical protein